MVDVLPFDAPSFFVLLAMGCFSLVLSLYFYLKHRALKAVSQNLTITVWDKTFNVFSPYETRKTMKPFTLLPVILILMYIFIGFLILKIFEIGLVLGISVFILSLGLMIVDAALDTRDNANLFMKAVRNKIKFGKGDLNTLFLVDRVMPKLSVYYVFTAIVFFASALALPYILFVAFSGLFQYVGVAADVTAPFGVWMPYITLFAFVFLFVMVYFMGGKLKNRIFDFPRSVPMTSMEEQFERIRIVSHWGEAPPYELSHRPVFEDAETEERKRKALESEE